MMENKNYLNYLSHDLKTPINSIKEIIELIKKEKLEDEVFKYLNLIETNIAYLNLLVYQLLDLARINDNNLVKYEKIFTLDDLVNEIKKITQVHLDKKDIKFEVNINVFNDTIKGDYVRIIQILINVLSNAINYTNQYGIIKLNITQLEYYIYRFEIIDNGCGMSDYIKKDIFKPYFKDKKSIGHGLGMPITKTLVDLLEGKIQIESAINVGTTFIIDLPLEALRTKDFDISGLKVLLIDDNEIVQKILSVLLTSSFVNVSQAYNGFDAIEMIKKQKDSDLFDVILLDICMPEIDGVETLQILRGILNGSNRKIPIIALTAKEDLSILQLFDEYLIKPVKKTDLFEKLSKYKM